MLEEEVVVIQTTLGEFRYKAPVLVDCADVTGATHTQLYRTRTPFDDVVFQKEDKVDKDAPSFVAGSCMAVSVVTKRVATRRGTIYAHCNV